MKEILLLFIGWVLGIFSWLFSSLYQVVRRRRGVARALIAEITEYTRDMRKELSLMEGQETLPEMASPLYKITYSRDFFDTVRDGICLFDPGAVEDLAKYYNVIKIIENDKAYLKKCIRDRLRDRDKIKDIYKAEEILRKWAIAFSSRCLTELAEESIYLPRIIREARNFAWRNGKMRKGAVVLLVIVFLIIGMRLGIFIGKGLYSQQGDKYEFISRGYGNPIILKIDKITGESWFFKQGEWKKVKEDTENGL